MFFGNDEKIVFILIHLGVFTMVCFGILIHTEWYLY